MIQSIILAAGSSKRFGQNKLNLDLLGKPVLHHVVDTVIEAGLAKPILVYYNKPILGTRPDEDIIYVYNQDAPEGMSTSVKCGLSHAPRSDGYMFINGDQPLISVDLLKALIDAYKRGLGTIIVPRYKGVRGNPTIFHHTWRKKLLEVTGDKGGRELIKTHPEEVYYVDIDDIYMGMDIDTKEDYRYLKELVRSEE